MRCHSRAWWRVLRLSLAAALSAWAGGLTLAQEGATPASTLFTADEPLRLRLEAPFSQVLRDRTDPDYQRGRLTYADAGGQETGIDLRVRVRGKSRAANCAFPPLLLNFPAEGLAETLFEGQNRLKLVTHCEPGEAYEQYIWLEYLAYRVLNLLTDASLRVRLVEATYYDSERGREVAVKPGFLIEDEERFAVRQGQELLVVTGERIERARYDQGALGLVEMFQYFIGNTDWSALAGPSGEVCCHNVVPLVRDDGSLVPVPYDFDASGLLSKPDALPAEGLPIRTVRQRLFRGPCRDLTEIEASFEPLVRNRAAITALFAGESRLTKQHADRSLSYLDEFYEVLADPERVERAFRFACSR